MGPQGQSGSGKWGRFYTNPSIPFDVPRPMVTSTLAAGSHDGHVLILSRFIQLLATHPYFVIHALGASARSAGQSYASVTKWKQNTEIPAEVKGMTVYECKPDVGGFSECGVVFSGLDHDVAGDIGGRTHHTRAIN